MQMEHVEHVKGRGSKEKEVMKKVVEESARGPPKGWQLNKEDLGIKL